jgi:hypothetical protein
MLSKSLPNIVDLPTDILDLIVGYFDHNRADTPPFSWQTSQDKETMQSLRLTCRRFYHCTSPRLLSRLRLSLDQKSLDLAAAVASNPLLAAGVRSVEVQLSYRSRKLAADLAAFLGFPKPILWKYEDDLDDCPDLFEWPERESKENEHDTSGSDSYDEEEQAHIPTEQYESLKSRYRALFTALDRLSTSTDPTTSDDGPLVEEFRATLLRSWEAYRHEQQKQHDLVTSSAFVRELTKAVSHMQNADTFWFHDHAPQTDPRDVERCISVVSDPSILDGILTAPLTWRVAEELDDDLVPARILSELPISLHQAGVSPRHLHIDCCPTNNQRALCGVRNPNGHMNANGRGWDSLRAASHALRTVRFGGDQDMIRKPIRLTSIAGDDKRCMDGFLGAILSGRALQDIAVDLYAFGLEGGDHPTDRSDRADGQPKGYYCVEDMLASLPEELPRLRRMHFHQVAMGQKTLERLCRLVGRAGGEASFIGIDLVDGKWHPLKQLLADKRGVVRMARLSGGEFGRRVVDWAESGDFIEGHWGP